MLIILGLTAVLLLLLLPILRVVFSLAIGLLAREGGKAREQYYRVEGAREQESLTDRLAVEYFEGGGFSVHGVVVAPGCHVILSLMAALFLSGGLLLSLLTLQGPAPGGLEETQVGTTVLHLACTLWQVAGPLIVLIGVLMLALATGLCHLASSRPAAEEKERESRSQVTQCWGKTL